MLRKYRALIIFIFILFAVGLGAIITFSYLHSFQKLSVSYDQNEVTKLELFNAVSQNGEARATGQAIKTLQTETEYKLKKGVYLLRASGEKIGTNDTIITLDKDPLTQHLDPDYSTDYLGAQLANEEPAIITALKDSNPLISKFYTVNPGTLYGKGEWYGTTLSYIGTESLKRDTLRVVLHLDNGSWVVTTDPPQIILSATSYPTVPKKVLSAVNALDLGEPVLPSR